MKPFLFTILCWSLLLGHSLFANSVVRFSSNVGEIDMELFDTQTPLTVANFLSYVNAGRYNQSFIHRSVPGFVIQGGLIGNRFWPFGALARSLKLEALISMPGCCQMGL